MPKRANLHSTARKGPSPATPPAPPDRLGAPEPSRAARYLTGWPAVATLLAAHALLAITSEAGKSITYDETAHIAAGVSYWRLNDYRLNPENGNLPQRWVAAPVALWGFVFPSTDIASWKASNVWIVADQFLFFTTGNDPETITALRQRLAGRRFDVMFVVVGREKTSFAAASLRDWEGALTDQAARFHARSELEAPDLAGFISPPS